MKEQIFCSIYIKHYCLLNPNVQVELFAQIFTQIRLTMVLVMTHNKKT